MHRSTRGHRHRGAGHRMRDHRRRGGQRRRGDVRSAILTLLAERPMHGYEMIGELEERTGGRWRPSAGSIYPTLQLLEDEGLVSLEQVDGRKVYSLTDPGRESAAALAERKAPWQHDDDDSPHQRLRREAFRLRAALMQVGQAGDADQAEKAVELLTDTRRKLYGILADE